MRRLLFPACLLAGLFPAAATAQEDYTSPLAGFKSVDELVNGAPAPDGTVEDDEAFDDLWFNEAQMRTLALVDEAGWVCDAWPMEGGDPMRTEMTASFMDTGDLFIREVNFATVNGQGIRAIMEYTADVVTDETDTEVSVGTKTSKLASVEGLPDGVTLNDPGPVEMMFQVVLADNPLDGYRINGYSEAGGETSMLTCVAGE